MTFLYTVEEDFREYDRVGLPFTVGRIDRQGVRIVFAAFDNESIAREFAQDCEASQR